jgi:tRNA modification GTPase
LDEAGIVADIAQLVGVMDGIIATADRGELLRTGLKVAIVGRPNVGKSSLLNAWSRNDRAIVTDLPGTTRDVVESNLVVGGIPIQVLDTAGIRETTDVVESIGVERSRQAAQAADLVLLTIAANDGWTAGDAAIYQQVQDQRLIVVVNKTDLVNPTDLTATKPDWPFDPRIPIVATAAAQNQGIDALEQAIVTLATAGGMQAANLDVAINQRQAAALTHARSALQQVQMTIAEQMPLDFWTIDLRSALQSLGEVLGEDVTESVLDRIFSRFCIGK